MDITELLKGAIGQQMVNGVAKEVGIGNDKAQSVVSTAIPLLLSAMQQNTNKEGGAQALLGALSKDHDGSILDNLGGYLQGGNFSDGMGILGHVLGGNQNNVANALGKSSGLNSGQIVKILAMVAPVVMGFLGKQNNQNNLNAGGLGSLLGGLLGGAQSQGTQLDAISAILGGGKSSGGGIGSAINILGGLFGGKK